MSSGRPFGRLDGARAVITGAGGGIGRAIALRLAEAGAAVALFDREDTADLVEQALAAGAPAASSATVDVGERAELQDAIDGAFPTLDILVTAAGIREVEHPLELAEDRWREVLEVNLSGTFWAAQAAARQMRSGGGSIVTIASIAGLIGVRSRAAYCASKHGIVGLTKQLAADLGADGIRVNCICPGLIRTPMTAAYVDGPEIGRHLGALVPLGRVGDPEDVADVALFLAGPLARYVTATTIAVDGGFVATGTFDPEEAGNYAVEIDLGARE